MTRNEVIDGLVNRRINDPDRSVSGVAAMVRCGLLRTLLVELHRHQWGGTQFHPSKPHEVLLVSNAVNQVEK